MFGLFIGQTGELLSCLKVGEGCSQAGHLAIENSASVKSCLDPCKHGKTDVKIMMALMIMIKYGSVSITTRQTMIA